MTKTTIKTEQTWEKLAQAKKPCPGCQGIGFFTVAVGYNKEDAHMEDEPCKKCASTGVVLVLPGLSEKCEDTHYRNVNSAPTRSARARLAPLTCKEAGCTGRVPKPIHLETLIKAMRTRLFGYESGDSIGENIYVRFYDRDSAPPEFTTLGEAEGKEIMAVTTKAAWKAIQARYSQEEKV